MKTSENVMQGATAVGSMRLLGHVTAQEIYRKYKERYADEIQGCCLLIADEIKAACGGEVVAGYLTWNGGSCKRTHWWVVADGKILDPMGDYLLSFEDYPGRREEHRDQSLFERLLPEYEQWRVA